MSLLAELMGRHFCRWDLTSLCAAEGQLSTVLLRWFMPDPDSLRYRMVEVQQKGTRLISRKSNVAASSYPEAVPAVWAAAARGWERYV